MEVDDRQGHVYVAASDYDELATLEDATSAGPTLNLLEPFADRYQHMPEARSLTWTDPFFEDDDDIVAVFDLDYDAMESFYTSIGWASISLTVLLYPPLFALSALTLIPCYLRTNVQWAVRAKHVAITRDGIKFVTNRRPCGWGLACMDIGKSSKTVPFDMITDCDILEPAGNECLLLFKVRIDTASSSKELHELAIAGLRDPHRFKKLVWAMKRAQQHQPLNRNALNMIPSKEGNDTTNDISSLLREIRDELRQNNEPCWPYRGPGCRRSRCRLQARPKIRLARMRAEISNDRRRRFEVVLSRQE